MKLSNNICPFCHDRKLTKFDDLNRIVKTAYDLMIEASSLLIKIDQEQLAEQKLVVPTKSALKGGHTTKIQFFSATPPRKRKRKKS